MYGIAGSHRSGKSTLARDLAAKLGIEYLETKVSGVFADLGLDPKADLPFAQRLDVQNAILKSLEIQYALRDGKSYIADRTPFDVLGYTMADIRRDTLDADLRRKVYEHVAYAEQIVKDHLAGVMLLRPLSGQKDVPTSAQACPLYMHHVYICVRDMLETITSYLVPHGFQAMELLSFDHAERMEDGAAFLSSLEALNGPRIWTPNS